MRLSILKFLFFLTIGLFLAKPTFAAIQRIYIGAIGSNSDAALVWDNTNDRLSVNSSTPNATLVVQGSSTAPTLPIFVVASSTSTQYLTVVSTGLLGVNSSTPIGTLAVKGQAGSTAPLVVASSTGVILFQVNANGSTTISSLGVGLVRSTSAGSLYVDNLTLSGSNTGDVTLDGTPDYITISGQVITRGTIDVSDDTNLTAGDALTLTGDDIDFDGGTSPGGSLGGTWASPTIDDLFPTYAYASSAYATVWNLKAGSNITITTSTPGTVTIASTGGGSGNSAWTILSGLIYNATSTDLVGIGTITPTTTLFVQGKGGTNPFAIASSTGAQLVTVTQQGRVGIGTSTPQSPFVVIVGNTAGLAVASTSIGNFYAPIAASRRDTIIGAGAGFATDFVPTVSSWAYVYPQTLIGFEAGSSLVASTTGAGYVSGIDNGVGFTDLFPYENTAVGFQALKTSTSAAESTAVGAQALENYQNALQGGDSYFPLKYISGNTAIGANSLLGLVDGGENTAVGNDTLVNHQHSWANTIMGFDTAFAQTTGNYNVIIGKTALRYSANNDQDTVIGANALFWHASSSFDTIVGARAGQGQITASTTATTLGNSLFGFQSAFNLTNGSNNSLFGYNSGFSLTTGSNNIIIGNNIDIASTTSNTLSVGNLLFGTGLTNFSNTSTLVSAGKIGIGTSTPIAKLTILASSTDATIPIFVLASSTGSTMFSINNNASATISSLGAGPVYSTASGNLYTGSAGIASGTAGSIQFSDGSSGFNANESKFVWDNTNKRLGINTSSPVAGLSIGDNNNNQMFLEELGSNYSRLMVGPTTTPLANSLGIAEFDINASNNLVIGSHSSGPQAGITTFISRGTRAAPTATQKDDFMLILSGRGYGTTTYGSNAKVAVFGQAEANWTDADQSTHINFNTTAASSTTRTERMRITGEGRIGIGTTTPAYKLTVVGTAGNNDILNVASSTGVSQMVVIANGNVGIASSSPVAKFVVASSTGVGVLQVSTTDPSSGAFFTIATPTSTTLFQVNVNGNVGINSTTPNYKFVVEGSVAMPDLTNSNTGDYVCFNTANGEIEQSGTACSLSSRRWKQNIQGLSYGLNEILKLRPVFYDLKPGYGTAIHQPGFIAEEALEVVPELVSYGTDGQVSGFDYPKLTAVLVKGMQELDDKVNDKTTNETGYWPLLGLLGLLGFLKRKNV